MMASRVLTLVLSLIIVMRISSGLDTERPNVLFIVVDDLRPSIGCYGGPIISPNIDQLAAQSAVFTNAMAQQALCGPSRTSFLTGRRPDTTKLYDFHSYWRDVAGNFTTIPQHFKENGYFTASVGKVFHPGTPSGGDDDYPYSWSIPAYHPSTEQYQYSKVCPCLDGERRENAMCPVDVEQQPEGTLPDIQAFERAAEIIRNLSSARMALTNNNRLEGSNLEASSTNTMTQPFFLGVGFRKPHLPWKYPKEYESLYPLGSVEIASNPNIPEGLPSVAWETFKRMRHSADIRDLKIPFPNGTIPISFHAPLRQSYYASATYMDYQVGRLLDVLEESGFADNTIVLLVGDHGWQLGEHAEWTKFSNFELATRVPLLVRVPGVTDRRSKSGGKFKLIYPLSQKKMNGKVANRERAKTIKLDRNLYGNSIAPIEELGERFLYDFAGENDVQRNLVGGNNGLRVEEFVELVDIFPTLSELANLSIPPVCPPKSFNVDFCAEGVSFASLIKSEKTQKSDFPTSSVNSNRGTYFTRWKNATFSQYPRESEAPGPNTDVPQLANITIMGYSMRTVDYHYTEWIGFNHTTFEGDWTDVKARELYINALDPDQNNNVASDVKYAALVQDLSQRLQRGWRDCLPQ